MTADWLVTLEGLDAQPFERSAAEWMPDRAQTNGEALTSGSVATFEYASQQLLGNGQPRGLIGRECETLLAQCQQFGARTRLGGCDRLDWRLDCRFAFDFPNDTNGWPWLNDAAGFTSGHAVRVLQLVRQFTFRPRRLAVRAVPFAQQGQGVAV